MSYLVPLEAEMDQPTAERLEELRKRLAARGPLPAKAAVIRQAIEAFLADPPKEFQYARTWTRRSEAVPRSRFVLRLRPETLAALDELAGKFNCPRLALIREAVNRFYEKTLQPGLRRRRKPPGKK